VASIKLRLLHPWERPHTYFSGGCLGLWTGMDGTESLANTGFRFPDRPIRSESLYRLSHPGHVYEAEQIYFRQRSRVCLSKYFLKETEKGLNFNGNRQQGIFLFLFIGTK